MGEVCSGSMRFPSTYDGDSTPCPDCQRLMKPHVSGMMPTHRRPDEPFTDESPMPPNVRLPGQGAPPPPSPDPAPTSEPDPTPEPEAKPKRKARAKAIEA